MSENVKIEVHALMHNELLLLPYFIRHYQQFADIYLYENNSTDGSPEFARLCGANVIELKTKDEINDLFYLEIKNNCWKKSKADWVIICDVDEFVYHPLITNILSHSKYTIYHPQEWIMYSEKFPTTTGQIYDEIKYGVMGLPDKSKMNLFRPDALQEINYTPGCHSCNPVGDVKICKNTGIKTLHFRYPSFNYRLKRDYYLASRLSDLNKKHGWGVHFGWDEGTKRKEFEEAMTRLKRVIPL